jgi:adenosylhomocysteine nucleosidase
MPTSPDTLLIVMALEQEAQGVLSTLGAQVLFTGVGKINAAYHLTRQLTWLESQGRTPRLVLNFGTAGSQTLATGSLVACQRFVQRDMDATGLGFELGRTPFDTLSSELDFPAVFQDLPHVTCGSADRFETRPVALPCDVFDMEAYALAKVCTLANVPFACVKYVTDGADPEAAQDWHSALPHAARAFGNLYQRLLNAEPAR